MVFATSCLSFLRPAGLLLLSHVFTVTALAETSVYLHGNLVIPECVINGNNSVEVKFGDVDIQSLPVSHTLYALTPFSVPMDCPYTLGVPKLTVEAPVASGGMARDGAIKTSRDGEGLVVYLRAQDGITPVVLNAATGMDISHSVVGSSGTTRTLRLNAGVGQLKGVDKLTAGAFTATASLQVRYE